MNQRKNTPAQAHATNHKTRTQKPQPVVTPPVSRPPHAPQAVQPKMATAAHAPARPKAPPVYRPQVKAVGVQAKMAGSVAQLKNHPVAPPVYQPQPVPKVLQTKSALAQTSHTAQAPRQSVAPVYRPELKKIVQPKMGAAQAPKTQKSPPGFRPQPPPRVLQSKEMLSQKQPGASIQRHTGLSHKHAHRGVPGMGRHAHPPMPIPRSRPAVIQRAQCPTHGVVYEDDDACWECVLAASKVQQKPNQVARNVHDVATTLDDMMENDKKEVELVLNSLQGNVLTHRGNTPPASIKNLQSSDLINHDESKAPVWFTVGKATTGNAIEGYTYHHTLTLNAPVSEIIGKNMGLTMNHSNSSFGEGKWPGYMVKTNERGCFAVSLAMLPTFYQTYVKSHTVEIKKKATGQSNNNSNNNNNSKK